MSQPMTERPVLSYHTAYVIWSHKRQAWWGPNRCGYAQSLAYAGTYSQDEARAIEADSQFGLPHERSEAMPLASAAGEAGAVRPHTVAWLLTMTERAA